MSPIYETRDGVLYVDGHRIDQYMNRSLAEYAKAIQRAFDQASVALQRFSVSAEVLERMVTDYNRVSTPLPKTSSKGHWRDVVPRRMRGRDR